MMFLRVMFFSILIFTSFDAMAFRFPSCEDLKKSCSPGVSPLRSPFEIAAANCQKKFEQLGCQKLLDRKKDPKLAKKFVSCTPYSMCKEVTDKKFQEFKGCFWNNVAEPIQQAVETSKVIHKCLKDPRCAGKTTMTGAMLILRPGYAGQLLGNMAVNAVKNNPDILSKSEQWLKDKGVQIQCYNQESRSQLLCFAALNLVGGVKSAAEVALKFPKIMELLGSAGLKVAKPAAQVARSEAAVVTAARSADNVPATPPRAEFGRRGVSEAAPARATEAVSDSTRERRGFGRREGGPRESSRDNIVREYGDVDVTTPQQHTTFITQIEKITEKDGALIYRSSNSELQMLNRVTNDKDLATALTNVRKSIEMKNFKTLESKYSNVDFEFYSDEKGVEILFRGKGGKPLPANLKAALEKDIERLSMSSQDEFVDYVKRNRVFRESDNIDASRIFHTSLGRSGTEANQIARHGRDFDGPNRMRTYRDREFKPVRETTRLAAEESRARLQSALGDRGLMQTVPNSDSMIPTTDVFDAIKKTKTEGLTDAQVNQAIVENIRARTNVTITTQEAKDLRHYDYLVDRFSAPLYKVSRQAPSLSDSANGGLSLDFGGMGAKNAEAVATALTRSRNFDDTMRLPAQEINNVTQQFVADKQLVNNVVTDELKKYGITAKISASGDDMVVKPSKPIPEEAKRNIAEALAEKMGGGRVRVASISDQVKRAEHRTPIATHGETIEKYLRLGLQGTINPERLKKALFMINMDSVSVGQGSARLTVASGSVKLTAEEQKNIQKAFNEAIKKVNKEYTTPSTAINYSPTN